MAANCPYVSDYKRRHYMMGYNDRLDGTDKREFENRKQQQRPYNKGYCDAGNEV